MFEGRFALYFSLLFELLYFLFLRLELLVKSQQLTFEFVKFESSLIDAFLGILQFFEKLFVFIFWLFVSDKF
jgi:hypothetical protein